MANFKNDWKLKEVNSIKQDEQKPEILYIDVTYERPSESTNARICLALDLRDHLLL